MRAALTAVLFLAAACGNSPVIDHSGDPGTPMPRAGASAAYDAANGTIVMFGGANRSGVLGETWTWDGAGWRLHHPKTSPPAREFAYMGFDPETRRVVVFGGLSCPPPGIDELLGCEYQTHSTALADTWTWDGSDWSVLETRHVPQVLGFRCCFGGAAADTRHGELILVTVAPNDPDFMAQTWVLKDRDWQRLHPKHSPLAQEFSNPAFDSVSGGLIVQQDVGPHGMCPSTGCVDRPHLRYDTSWSWDGSDWNDLGRSVNTPHGYGNLLSVGQHGLLLIVAGGFVHWNGSSWEPPQALPEAVSPMLRPRYDWTAAYHAPTDRLVLVGGRTWEGNHLFGATVAWDGSNWVTLRAAPSSPSTSLGPCSVRKALSSNGGGFGLGGSDVSTLEYDFFEPPAGPCHLTTEVVLTLVDANGAPLAIPGNPSTQPVNADLTWDAGGQRVIFTITGTCQFAPGATADVHAGDFQLTGQHFVPSCGSDSRTAPSITPSVRSTGLRP
jgi:hypothetical protein